VDEYAGGYQRRCPPPNQRAALVGIVARSRSTSFGSLGQRPEAHFSTTHKDTRTNEPQLSGHTGTFANLCQRLQSHLATLFSYVFFFHQHLLPYNFIKVQSGGAVHRFDKSSLHVLLLFGSLSFIFLFWDCHSLGAVLRKLPASLAPLPALQSCIMI